MDAHADSWAPPQKAVYQSEGGRFAVAIDPDGESPGAQYALTIATGARRGAELAKGRLAQVPYTVVVSSRGLGFAAIENYGMLGLGFSAILVSSEGAVVAEERLEDLFTKDEIEAFPATVSSIWWLRDSWIDEERRAAVVVSNLGQVREISFGGTAFSPGKVQKGDGQLVLRAFLDGRESAADLMATGAFPDARPGLLELFNRPKGPKALILRAAVALSALGDRTAQAYLDAALESERLNGLGFDDIGFAVRHLRDAFGEDALPRLAKLLTKKKSLFTEAAADGLKAFGPRAIPVYIEVVAGGGSSLGRVNAIKALQDFNAVEAVLALSKAARDKDDLVAAYAIDALGMIRSTMSVAGLMTALDEGGPRDADIAQALTYCYDPRPVPALIRALRRWPTGSKERDRIALTLRFITHEEFPPDPEVWEKWFAGNPVFDPTRFPQK